jgi:GT2 family glycosyltransferase/glycosyltransferase involved in cell wall biosynthesis
MGVLWGVSFDATPISGVVVEFIKVANVFHDRGFRVYLDLGYDIKADKQAFFRRYGQEPQLLPDWIHLARIDELETVDQYGPEFVTDVLGEVVGRGDGSRLAGTVDQVAAEVRERILATWERHEVSFVVVENGTLPENITYTRALYDAIEEYGSRHRLGRFVLWRDHDLMWQSEPSAGKYGTFPYPYVPTPRNSPFIRYVVLNEEGRQRMMAWAPELNDVEVLPNAFAYGPATVNDHNAAFRRDHGIPDVVPLIARFTRIIPQKRIDRDIHLLAALPDAYLFVAGDTTESPSEYAHLTALADRLGVADRVVFGGPLAPLSAGPGSARRGYSIGDLLAHCTVASFLTSSDYDSYGNPIGEAITSGVAYLTSRYDMYDAVYASKGFRAPVLDIREHDLPTGEFVAEVNALLTDPARRRELAEFNRQLGKLHLSDDRATVLVESILGPSPASHMDDRTRVSVVVPVYNEADNLLSMLDSLYDQRAVDGPLDRSLYEIVLVDNNSTDNTVELAGRFGADHPDLRLHVIHEPEQGVSCARRAGMQFASARSRDRDVIDAARFYLVSADADCRVDGLWLWELLTAMESTKAAIAVCNYSYAPEHFAGRPRLWQAISKTLRCRAVTFALFGGFPDGKGFAVDRDVYQRVGGIQLLYQLKQGRFVNHLSDDWDFGIRVRSSGEDIIYAPQSKVEINPRRVDHALDEVIRGRAYGSGGTIVMRDIRVPPSPLVHGGDLTEEQARMAWEYSIKDFVPKNTILPVLLTPSFLHEAAVAAFFGPALAERLGARIAEIKEEMRLTDFTPIHAYKTPSYRLYFEFAEEIFACLRRTVGEDIGYPPPLPACLQDVSPQRFSEFVHYYCEDRESGEAHNYFGNGGVF